MTVQLYRGDGLEFMAELADDSVDAVITDPPYARQYMPLYGAIARESSRILKRGGSYLAIVPHYSLPAILADVGQHLKYRWCISMWQGKGKHPRMAMGIEIMWKPIVWWVKGAWPQGRGFVRDGFENDEPNKSLHPWEQAIGWADFCLKFVPADGVVIDPLMGSGTVGVACVQTGYDFLGCEIDEASFAIAKQRIEIAEELNRQEKG